VSKYEKFFRDADTDGSGFLSFDELVAALRKGGYTKPDSQIKVYFHLCFNLRCRPRTESTSDAS